MHSSDHHWNFIKCIVRGSDEDGKRVNDIGCMIVYLRDISDYNSVKEYINEYYDSIPCVIVHAKVCRPEWLVEIECLALKKI